MTLFAHLGRLREVALTVTAVAAALGVIVASVAWVWAKATEPIAATLAAEAQARRGADSLIVERLEQLEAKIDAVGAGLYFPPGSTERRQALTRFNGR